MTPKLPSDLGPTNQDSWKKKDSTTTILGIHRIHLGIHRIHLPIKINHSRFGFHIRIYVPWSIWKIETCTLPSFSPTPARVNKAVYKGVIQRTPSTNQGRLLSTRQHLRYLCLHRAPVLTSNMKNIVGNVKTEMR